MDDSAAQPFPSNGLVITDGGLETWLLFQHGVDLPAFAAYPLVDAADGRALLSTYYRGFVDIAAHYDYGLQLEAPTWRANPDWAHTLGHSRDELARYIDRSVELVAAIKDG